MYYSTYCSMNSITSSKYITLLVRSSKDAISCLERNEGSVIQANGAPVEDNPDPLVTERGDPGGVSLRSHGQKRGADRMIEDFSFSCADRKPWRNFLDKGSNRDSPLISREIVEVKSKMSPINSPDGSVYLGGGSSFNRLLISCSPFATSFSMSGSLGK